MTLTFIHLSDIHFNRRHASDWDPDEDLRSELVRDLKLMTERLGRADHVLITGDVAFSGKATEYAPVGDWLGHVVGAACQSNSVLTVPGNHDIDRSIAASSRLLRMAQDRIRDVPDHQLDQELEEALRDHEVGPALLSPLAAYNDFAAKFGCQVTPARPWWERRFPLGDGYDLRLRGATSVLVSDHLDDENTKRLAVPAQMMTLPRDPHSVGAVLAHHPPEWMRRRDYLGDLLNARAKLQLFGHRHVFRLRKEAENLVVHAGATQPERDHGWAPHYNILQLDTVKIDNDVALRVVVYPRRWYSRDMSFGVDTDPGGTAHRRFDLLLGAASPLTVQVNPSWSTPPSTNEVQAPEAAHPAMLDSEPKRHVVKMPHVESMFVGTVTRWWKAVGDSVKMDERLVDVATDKVDLEVPSPVAGTLAKIIVPSGGPVAVNSELGIIEC